MEEERAEKNKVRNWTVYGLLVTACLGAYYYLEMIPSRTNPAHMSSFFFVSWHIARLGPESPKGRVWGSAGKKEGYI